MKLLPASIIWVIVLFLVMPGLSQQTGVIEYTESYNQHRNLPERYAYIKAQIPEYYTVRMKLYFNGSETLYKNAQKVNLAEYRYSTAPPENSFYANADTRKTAATQTFSQKNYLVRDSLELAPWKLGTEKKMILGYLCQIAYYTDITDPQNPRDITAWFTAQLRPFIGPERFNTLPGAVLAVDINSGERTYVATKIELRELTEEEQIRVPEPKRKAKEITYKEYREMELEVLNRYRANGVIMLR